MTLEERFEALTMNLELTARDVAELQNAIAEMRKVNAEMQKTDAILQQRIADFERATEQRFAESQQRVAQWEFEKKHLDEKVDSLADSTRMLLAAVQGQQTRIERVERRIS